MVPDGRLAAREALAPSFFDLGDLGGGDGEAAHWDIDVAVGDGVVLGQRLGCDALFEKPLAGRHTQPPGTCQRVSESRWYDC